MHTTQILYTALIFLAVALGGLSVLRRQRSRRARVIVFLVFCAVCIYLTLFVTKRWQLLMGEAAIAWVVALLILAIISATVRVLRVRPRDG